MKANLIEVAFTFHQDIDGGQNWRQFTLRVGKHKGRADWSFSLGGPEEPGDVRPVELIEGIQEALAWAKTQVRSEDLREHERDCCID